MSSRSRGSNGVVPDAVYGSATSARPRAASALLDHLREPMRRSAYALIAGTAVTSLLGLVFWVLAARWLPPATVGIGAALVSLLTLLANISTLGLRNGLVRFLPEAGSATRRLVASSYALCAAAAMAAAAVFLIGQPWWAEELGFLRGSPLAAVAFVAAVAVWVLFILQDHVLTGLHKTVWVPITNAICSVAKIALVPLLAFTAGWAILSASVLPAAVMVAIVTVLILRQPPGRSADAGPPVIPMARLVRFAATDHVAALVWLGTADILTLMLLQQLGPESSAFYFMANTIAYGLYLVTSNISSALVAEGARSPDRVPALTRAALRNSARLVLPAAALGIILTRPVLGMFGRDYADQASALLQLLLLSAVPQIVIGIALAAARLRHDMRTIALTYGALAVTTLGGSWVAVMLGGLNGVGVACLVSEVLVALLLLLTGRSGLWPDRPGRRRLLSEVERVALGMRRAWSRREIQRRLVPALEACGLESTAQHRLLTSDSDVLVVALDCPPVGLVVKIATSPAASAGLNRHADLLTWLGPELGASSSAAWLPQVVYRGTYWGERVVVETGLHGSPAPEPAADRRLDPQITAAALAAIAEIHQRTALPTLLDRTVLRDWVDEPLDHLRRLPAWAAPPAALDRLADALYESLTGRLVTAAVVHGDFWSGNVLFGVNDAGTEVTGVVDWENARRVGLPDTDLVHWWLAGQPAELGAAVRQALASPEQAAAELAALPVPLPNPHLAVEDTVLLTWLGHVSAGLARATRNPLSPVWVARNIRPVVQRFATARTRRLARAA
jgi:O-antigen/teichoic acid export membrane protein